MGTSITQKIVKWSVANLVAISVMFVLKHFDFDSFFVGWFSCLTLFFTIETIEDIQKRLKQ